MPAPIRAGIKRAILNSFYRQSQQQNQSQPAGQNLTLILTLQSYADALVMGIQTGRMVEAHTGSGKAVKFHTPVLGEQMTQADMVELAQDLLEIYNDALIALSAQGNNSPGDDQILAQMLADDRLQSVTTTRRDYTLVNYPNRF